MKQHELRDIIQRHAVHKRHDMSYKKGHNNKGIEGSGNDDKHLASVFDSDAAFVYVYKKTERIAMAVYMVTDIINDSDPLKNNVRDSVLELLNAVTGLKDRSAVERDNQIRSIHEHIMRIVSLLDIAYTTGFITEMNASILKREFFDLVAYMKERNKDAPAGSFALSSNFFEVRDETPRETHQEGEKRTFSEVRTNVTPAAPASPNNSLHELDHGSEKPQERTSGNGRRNVNKKTKTRRGRPSSYIGNVAKNERRAAIFNLLREKKEITVRDLAAVVTDCSEKTLQRELLQLVDEGVLNKEGERRWSRYSLVV